MLLCPQNSCSSIYQMLQKKSLTIHSETEKQKIAGELVGYKTLQDTQKMVVQLPCREMLWGNLYGDCVQYLHTNL